MVPSLRFVTLASLLSLASCAVGCASAAPEEEGVDSTSQDVTTVCGAKTNGAVQGVDVSHYQGNFNWMTANVQFGYAQVSDGISNPDPLFSTNWANMKKAKILRGAYQFFRPNEDEVAQANLVVSKIGKLQPGDLPAMIDVEVTGGIAGATIGAKVKHWLQIVEAGTGVKPIIYTGSYFWQDNVGTTNLGAYPIWIAAYGSACPAVPPGWNKWLVWQYSDGNGALDHDVFNGTLAQLKALSPQPPAPPIPAKPDAGAKDAGAHDAATEDGGEPEGTTEPGASPNGDDDGGATEVSMDEPPKSGGCSITRAPSSRASDSTPAAALLALVIAACVRRARARRSSDEA
jgi:lysozyme